MGRYRADLTFLRPFFTFRYTSLVHYTDGSSHLFDRRERPHMVFEENTTKPVALSNSARPGGLDGDRTFTLVQGLRIGMERGHPGAGVGDTASGAGAGDTASWEG